MDLIKGSPAKVNWQNFSSALLIETKRGDKVFTASSVAIGKNIILTSAHCLEGVDSGRVILDSEYDPNTTNSIEMANFYIHPDYNPQMSLYENDLAIIFLVNDLPDHIVIPQFEKNLNLWSDTKLNRIGFGGRNNKNRKTWTDPVLVDWQNNNQIIRLSDTCSVLGDSGGPLFYVHKDTPYLVGLHSTLEGASLTYAVHVAQYGQWIQEVIATNYFLLVS
jgi:secreted trypsin-like serine protease